MTTVARLSLGFVPNVLALSSSGSAHHRQVEGGHAIWLNR